MEIDESFKKLLHDIDLLIDESYKLWDKISVQSKEIEDYREQELQRLKDKSIYKNSVEDLKSSTVCVHI